MPKHFKYLPDEEQTEDYVIVESSRMCKDIAHRNGYLTLQAENCYNGDLGCEGCPWGDNQ